MGARPLQSAAVAAERVSLDVECARGARLLPPRAAVCAGEGLIPGVVYGGGGEPTAIAVAERELRGGADGLTACNAILDVRSPARGRPPVDTQGLPADRSGAASPQFDLGVVHLDGRSSAVTMRSLGDRPARGRAACSHSGRARWGSRHCRWRCRTGSRPTSPRWRSATPSTRRPRADPRVSKLPGRSRHHHSLPWGPRASRGARGGARRGRGGKEGAGAGRGRGRGREGAPRRRRRVAFRVLPSGRGRVVLDLLRGVGNPGREYARDRHNAARLVVDESRAGAGAAYARSSRPDSPGSRARRSPHRPAEPERTWRVAARSRRPRASSRWSSGRCSPATTTATSTGGPLQVRLGGGLAGPTACARSRVPSARKVVPALASASAGPGRGDPRFADYVLPPTSSPRTTRPRSASRGQPTRSRG